MSLSVLEHHVSLIPALCALLDNSKDPLKFVRELQTHDTSMKVDDNSQKLAQIIQGINY